MKLCRGCGEEKPTDMFHKHERMRDGSLNFCKSCSLERKRSAPSYANAAYRRDNRYKRLYGISYDTYVEAIQMCDNRCAICNEFPAVGKDGILVVDHNHNTGEIRGLLCSKCNSGLGMFRDRPDLLEAALKYLQAYGHYGEKE